MQGKDCLKYFFIVEYLSGSTLAHAATVVPRGRYGHCTGSSACLACSGSALSGPVAQVRKEVFDGERGRLDSGLFVQSNMCGRPIVWMVVFRSPSHKEWRASFLVVKL